MWRETEGIELSCTRRTLFLLPLFCIQTLTHKIQIGLHHLGISTSPRWTRNRFTGICLVNILCKDEEKRSTNNNQSRDSISTFAKSFFVIFFLFSSTTINYPLTNELESGQFPGALLRDQNRRWTHILVDYVPRVVQEGEGLDYLQDSVLEFNVQELVLLDVMGFQRAIRRRLWQLDRRPGTWHDARTASCAHSIVFLSSKVSPSILISRCHESLVLT